MSTVAGELGERAATGTTSASAHLVEDDTAWDGLVAACPGGEIFHSSTWLRLLRQAYGVTTARLGLERDGVLVAGLPVVIRSLGPVRIGGSPLYNVATPQMGPLLLCPEDLPRVLAAFDEFQRQRRLAMAEIIFGEPSDGAALRLAGYSVAAANTHVVDLDGRAEDDLWRGLAPRCRTAIRKAEREGVSVEEIEPERFWPDFRPMVEMVFARQRRVPPIPAALHTALGRLLPRHQLWTVMAHHQSRPVAGAVFLTAGRRQYYFDGASDPAANHLCANNLIQWWALRRGLREGLACHDMMGAGIPGVATFKASFGGRLIVRPHARRTNSPWAAAALAMARAGLPVLRSAKFIGANLVGPR